MVVMVAPFIGVLFLVGLWQHVSLIERQEQSVHSGVVVLSGTPVFSKDMQIRLSSYSNLPIDMNMSMVGSSSLC